MKKLFVVFYFLTFIIISSDIFAKDTVIPWELPYVTQGYTFNQMACSINPVNNYTNCFYGAEDSLLQLRFESPSYLGVRLNASNGLGGSFHFIQCTINPLDELQSNCSTIVLVDYGNTSSYLEAYTGAFYSTNVYNDFIPNNTTVLYSANYDPPENDTLTITINPLNSGTVEVGEIPCTTCPCVYTLSQVNQSNIHATANTGYAFGYWKETTNPYPITPNGNKSMTAVFFRIFRDTTNIEGEGFRYNVEAIRGECVIYVREETDIPYAACHGDAADCFNQAQAMGFSTGNIPKAGAIAVFDRGTFPDVGHVGIVKEVFSETSIRLRHSNYSTYHAVSEETIDLTTHPALGYIYFAYPTP